MKNDSRSLVRVANRQLVLQQLFNHPATTRVDIARELKINKSTVSAIYNELMMKASLRNWDRVSRPTVVDASRIWSV